MNIITEREDGDHITCRGTVFLKPFFKIFYCLRNTSDNFTCRDNNKMK